MAVPPLVHLPTEADYRAMFGSKYCTGPIVTHDGIEVRFKPSNFDHCFFERSNRRGEKDTFSARRATHIDWIAHSLTSGEGEEFCGWDSKRRRVDHDRRVAILSGHHVTVIRLTNTPDRAAFVTAYVADAQTVLKVRRGTRWSA